MHRVDAGRSERREVIDPHPATGHELDRTCELLRHAGERSESGPAVRFAAGCQHAAHTRPDERHDGTDRVGGGIDDPVHRHIEVLGNVAEPCDRVDVEGTGIRQRPNDDAIGTERPCESDVARDRVEFLGVVDEAASARAHENMHEARGGCRGGFDR